MLKEFRLTTIDNPFDPFEDFSSWYLHDQELGYCTCEYLARTLNLVDGMTEREIIIEKNRAITEIIKHDPLNIYIKVERDTEFE